MFDPREEAGRRLQANVVQDVKLRFGKLPRHAPPRALGVAQFQIELAVVALKLGAIVRRGHAQFHRRLLD